MGKYRKRGGVKRIFTVLLCLMLMMNTTGITVFAEGAGEDVELTTQEDEILTESTDGELLDDGNLILEAAEDDTDASENFENEGMDDEIIPEEAGTDEEAAEDFSPVANETLSSGETESEAADELLDDGVTTDEEVILEEDETKDEEAVKYPAFEESKTVDGVKITVSADEGVFPANAELSVETVPVYQQQQADAAVDEVRDENQNVAVSYTFDIKVIDPETNEEYQPAEGQTVSVSFALAEVADENLETQVYHVTEDEATGELTAESLDVNTETTPETGEETTAVVETDGFSLYTVEFTYNNLEYVLPGDTSVPMSEILTTLGLTGEVTQVTISDTSLFSASNETGEWIVTAHQAFDSTEWMKVTINGVVYEITVTDTAEISVTVNVTGSGSVSIGNQTATEGNSFTTSVDDGASVTLTFAPDAGNIVTGAKLSYKPSEDGTAEENIAISGSTATCQMPNDIWNGTGVTINVTFGDGLIGGADEASAVALTDATVSNLAGGYYKVESDISFDHTLNLIGDTYLVIASGAKMTVSSSEYGIKGGSYALNVLGEGTLNVTTTGSYKIAVYVSSYTQSGCSVNLTTTYIGMRCSDSFNISGGSFKTNGSEGIWPNNDVNISGGKLEASNIDSNINLSYSSTDDYIKVDTYTNGKTMTIANGQTFTDGATNYSGTIENLSALNGKKLFPFAYTHLTVRDATCTEVGIKQECWQRSSDGKYFSDENGTNELNASDVEIPMIAHTGVHHDATDTHIEYWQCSMCGKYFSEEGCTTEITEEETKIYRTITIDGSISSLVTSNVDKAVAGTTVTLTVSYLIDASTLRVNDGSVALTDAGNGTYTFTVPAADVTVTASTATTYSVNLPANMEIVSATTTADGDGKYISGTVVTFKASFFYTASNVSDGANTLTADGSGNYSVTVGTADITVTATIEHSSNIDLSQAPGDFTVVDGDILTAATSHTVTIAENAKITLSNATISGGIVCEGTATITLVGTNSVTGASFKAGIQVGGSGTTLTIKGNGSLTANGGDQSAGIGLSRAWDVDATGGDIVIEGGNITATGNDMGAGIGTGVCWGGNSDKTATLGNITIKGGTVRAIGGTNNSYPGNGIGKGGAYSYGHAVVGTITIYDGIDMVDASSISESIVYMHGESEVTANKTEYFTIIENGNRLIIVQKVTPTIADVPDQTYTGSEITPEPLVLAGSLSLTKGTDYEYSYTNNTNVGTATVRATFQGDYESLGYVEKEFTILPSTVVVNVTGNGTVTYNDKVATNGEVIGVTAEKGTDVTLTFAPENGYAVRSVEYGYTNSNETTMNGAKLPINGTTATLTVPNDLKDGTYVNLTVTFVSAINGGADEASAVALTDNTVTDLGGGWYKVENNITFDHTLNLLADTYLTIAKGKTMTVNTASGKAIDSEYTLNVSGEGALNITTTDANNIAVRVGNYVQTGATVTASGYIGIRCMDNFIAFNFDNDFTFSGGQLTATGSGGNGINADNDITLSCSNATDFIQASSYRSTFGAVKIAEGKALTDGTNTYSGTLSSEQVNLIAGKNLEFTRIGKISSAKVYLQNDISVVMYATFTDEPTSASMVVTLNGKETNLTGVRQEEKKYAFTFDGICPEHIGDSFTAVMTYVVNDETYTDILENYSVKKYCMTILEMSDTDLQKLIPASATLEETRCMAVDVLYYGDEAQNYMNHNTGNLATSDLTSAQAALATTYVTPTSEEGVVTTMLSGTKDDNYYWYSAKANLDNAATLQFYFMAPNGVEGLTVEIGGVEYTIHSTSTSGKYYVEITRMSAGDFRKVLTAKFKLNGTETGQAFSYSMNTYVSQVENHATFGSLAQRLYNYGKSAYNYAN